MLNIVFGSLKTTVAGNSAPSEFGFASMKLEANRGPKTSRRILFNREAAALLRLPKGAVQNLLFGFAQPDANNATPRLFVLILMSFYMKLRKLLTTHLKMNLVLLTQERKVKLFRQLSYLMKYVAS